MQGKSNDDQTYNGWTNYATWGVALVLDNDQHTYETVRGYAASVRSDAPTDETRDGWIRFTLAEQLQDYTEELCGLEADEDTLSLMARQVLQAGLAEVNWDEIAENIVSEFGEQS